MKEVVLERRGNGVAVIRLNRPEARNALNMAMRKQLAEHFRAISASPDVRCVVLAGHPRFFAAGADVSEMADASSADLIARAIHLLWGAIAACPQPVIAAVNGYALGGGCELAMHADIIIAGEGSSFGHPEVRLGIMPGAGGTQRLTRAVGKFRAMHLLLTGDPLPAAEALAAGLVSQVVPDDETFDTAIALAERIADLPATACRQIKEVVLVGSDLPLSAALVLERNAYQLLYSTPDQKEGMRAFLEKRPAQFNRGTDD